jgi:hypothetical protein
MQLDDNFGQTAGYLDVKIFGINMKAILFAYQRTGRGGCHPHYEY